jgi:phosphatidylglycerophosphate synthase
VCGVLDDADGYIARKYNKKSKMGAFLDTAVDFFTLLVMLVIAYKKLGTRLVLCFVIPLILLIICYKRYELQRETQGKLLWPIPNALTHVFVFYAILILLP